MINKHSFNAVWKRLLKFYPEEAKSKDGYKGVYLKLKGAKVPKKYKNRFITINKIRKSRFNEEAYVNVGTRVDGKDYSMSFINWYELLGYRVVKPKNYSDIIVVAYWLWEATYYGYEEETIESTAKEIVGKIKLIKEESVQSKSKNS